MHLQVCVYVGVCVCECLFVCVRVIYSLHVLKTTKCASRVLQFLFYFIIYSILFFCSLFALHCVLTM